MNDMPSARRVALDALLSPETPGRFVEHWLDASPAFAALSAPDRGLAREIVFGVIRNRALLDHLVAPRTVGRRQRPEVEALLRMGAYQLFFLDRIPEHAAVHESVRLARDLGLEGPAGFLNAVLRTMIRERDAVRAGIAKVREEDPAVGWSHPRWLVRRWKSRLAASDLRALLEWNNTPPPTCARINTPRHDASAVTALWTAEGVAFRPADRDWAAGFELFELTSHPPLESLGSFRQGMFYVQDPSTLLAPAVLAPPKDARVLDLCAAPGGKTTALASLLRGTGVVVAHDADPTRLGRLRENRARLGLDNVEVPAGAPEGIFDRVLVDAPCSNTGVLRRRVELRWRIRAEEISRLAALQSRLLADAARHVAPGGALVYSTCSVEPEENGAVADGFVREAPDFFEVARRELHPVRDGVDGAFVARFERRS